MQEGPQGHISMKTASLLEPQAILFFYHYQWCYLLSTYYVLDIFQYMFLLSESMLPTIHPRSYYYLILQERKPIGRT